MITSYQTKRSRSTKVKNIKHHRHFGHVLYTIKGRLHANSYLIAILILKFEDLPVSGEYNTRCGIEFAPGFD